MKTGRTIESLYSELEHQRNYRKDYIADTRSLTVSTKEKHSIITLDTGSSTIDLKISDLAHRQIAERLQISFNYYINGSFVISGSFV